VSDPHWWVGELAHWIGAMPLLWLAIRRSRNRTHWLLAAAFGVSFVADTAAHWVSPDLIGNLYPLAQAGLIAYALLPLLPALHLIGALTLVSLAAVWLGAWEGRDVILTSAASLVVLACSHYADAPLRPCLWTAFGLGLLAWLYYAALPDWFSWSAYQGIRLAAAGLFCYGTWEA
jgi:hypothetical protein